MVKVQLPIKVGDLSKLMSKKNDFSLILHYFT